MKDDQDETKQRSYYVSFFLFLMKGATQIRTRRQRQQWYSCDVVVVVVVGQGELVEKEDPTEYL